MAFSPNGIDRSGDLLPDMDACLRSNTDTELTEPGHSKAQDPEGQMSEVSRALDESYTNDTLPAALPVQKPLPTMRKFQKANSAATFLLDGMAYTIVATPPGKVLNTEGMDTSRGRRSHPNADPGEGSDATGRDSSTAAAVAAASVNAARAGGATGMVNSSSSRSSSSSSPMTTGARESCDAADAAECLKIHKPATKKEEPEGPRNCCVRLRDALKRVQNEVISKQELTAILEHTIQVLEANAPDENRLATADDDEEVFSNVETEVVPTEVRDWLAMTFTRSNTNLTKRKVSDIPKFRSVAHAIRAGILVDRIYRRQASTVGLQLPFKTISQMRNLDKWSFDVFAVNDVSDGHALKYIGYELLQRYDLINKFKINIQTLENFLIRMEQGYSKYSNPYHNLLHAADVAQTLYHVISTTSLTLWLSDLDVLSAIFAALIHDYEHTGTTNTFHVNTSSPVALLYNDRSVLENHHLTATFRLLQEEEFNVVSNLKPEDYREFRSLVIDIVLATDMSGHFVQLKNMKNLLLTPDNIDKTKALSLIVHCADISHPSKEWRLHERWTAKLIEEFFQQGDREEKLGKPISPLCDRKNTLVAESQIGFIDFIVEPSMQVMGDMVDAIMEKIQERNSTPKERNSFSSTTEESVDKIDKIKTPSSPVVAAVKMDRQWEPCLVTNRQMWKERAANGWISPLQATLQRVEESEEPKKEDQSANDPDGDIIKHKKTLDSTKVSGDSDNTSLSVDGNCDNCLISDMQKLQRTEDDDGLPS